MRILISGSLAFDTIMDFPGVFTDHIIPEKLHTLSLSFLVENVKRHFGGTAGNIAYSLALMGEHPVILSQLGVDAKAYQDHLSEYGISNESIRVVKEAQTASAWIMTDRRDNQIASFYPGAMKYPATTKTQWKKNRFTLAICAPGSSSDRLALAKWCRTTKTPWIFDPGQGLTDMSKAEILSAMKGSLATIVNDYELDLLLKRLSVTKDQLWKLTAVLITTLGERGSVVEVKKEVNGERLLNKIGRASCRERVCQYV